MLERDQDLSEIPAPQKRPVPKSLAEYDKQATDRDHAITLAYESGGYSMKEIGSYCSDKRLKPPPFRRSDLSAMFGV